jgi:LPS export ABC transporter protein LptC
VVLQTKSTVIILLLCFAGMISCSNESVISTVLLENDVVMPTIHGENIVSLISDSGITRYRLHAKTWDMYVNDTVPYWFFPEGIYIEKFDSLFNTEGYIKADTAYFFEKKELWQLIGNVHIQNIAGDVFDTSEMFYDQKKPANSVDAIYSDKFVRVVTATNWIVTGEGFRSNQTMSNYRFYHNTFETIIDENEPIPFNDSIQRPEMNQ